MQFKSNCKQFSKNPTFNLYAGAKSLLQSIISLKEKFICVILKIQSKYWSIGNHVQ